MTRSEEIAELRRRIELLESEDEKDAPRWVDATEDHIGCEANFCDDPIDTNGSDHLYSSTLAWVNVDYDVDEYPFCDTTGSQWKYCKVIDPFPLEGEVVVPDDRDLGKVVAAITADSHWGYIIYLGPQTALDTHFEDRLRVVDLGVSVILRKLWPSERAQLKALYQYEENQPS